VIFGHFIDPAGVFHGYRLENGSFTQLDYPGALDTLPFYLNASGDLAGEWDTNPAEIGHAFVRTRIGELDKLRRPRSATQQHVGYWDQ